MKKSRVKWLDHVNLQHHQIFEELKEKQREICQEEQQQHLASQKVLDDAVNNINEEVIQSQRF